MVIEPGHQLKVICQSPETSHGGMRVAIDQPRHDDSTVRIYKPGGAPVGKINGRSDCRDRIFADGDRAVAYFRIVCI